MHVTICLYKYIYCGVYIISCCFAGVPGFAAWLGIEVLADPKPGSNVFISAASGGVGMIAGQLAKIRGCRVIGSTGSDEKVISLKILIYILEWGKFYNNDPNQQIERKY